MDEHYEKIDASIDARAWKQDIRHEKITYLSAY